MHGEQQHEGRSEAGVVMDLAAKTLPAELL